jgi:hypothetical protein
MWEKGHSFDEIDDMNIADFGDIIGYWNEESRVEKKRARQKKRSAKRR